MKGFKVKIKQHTCSRALCFNFQCINVKHIEEEGFLAMVIVKQYFNLC
jgi:hypothetical protein